MASIPKNYKQGGTSSFQTLNAKYNFLQSQLANLQSSLPPGNDIMTLSTVQTATGEKTFSDNTHFSAGAPYDITINSANASIVLTDGVNTNTITPIGSSVPSANSDSILLTQTPITNTEYNVGFFAGSSGYASCRVDDTRLTFNPSTDRLRVMDGSGNNTSITPTSVTSATFIGDLSGTATGATDITITDSTATAGTFYPTFVNSAGTNKSVRLDTGFSYVPSTDTLTVTNVNGTTTHAIDITVTDTTSGAGTYYPTFVNTAGTQKSIRLDTDLTFTPTTNTLTCPNFAGNATSATTATNLAGGIASQIPYQTGAGTTAFIPNGNGGDVLYSNGTGAPFWAGLPAPPAPPDLQAVLNQGNIATGVSALFVDGSNRTTTVGNNEVRVLEDDTTTYGSATALLTATSSIGASCNLSAVSVPDPLYGSSSGVANLSATLGSPTLGLGVSAPFTNSTSMTLGVSSLTHFQDTGSPSPNDPLTISTNKNMVIASQDFNVSGGSVTATTFTGALVGNADTATLAGQATNIAGGAGGSIPYQTAVNTTALLANGTAGQVLTSAGTTLAPTWATPTGLPANPGGSGLQYMLFNDGTTNTWDDVRNTGSNMVSLFSNFNIATVAGRSSNLAIGPGTMSNLTGNATNNTAIGVNALVGTATSYNNVTAVGFNAGGSTSFSSTQANNVFVGNGAGAFSSGTNNVYIGGRQVAQSATGSKNVVVGGHSFGGGGPGTGSNCTIIGSDAGRNIFEPTNPATGSNNTYIGFEAGGSPTLPINQANTVVLGNGSVATFRCNVALTVVSDARDKKDFVPLDAGIDFVNELKPIRFEWNKRDGGLQGKKDVGFTAQSLQETQATTGIEIPNLVNDDAIDSLSIMPTQLIPVLVKALQELSAEVKMLKALLASK